MKKMKKIFSILLSCLMLASFIVPQSMVLADDGSAYELSMEQAAQEMPEEEAAPEAQAETEAPAPEDASLPVQTEAETEKENAPPAEAADPYQGAAVDISALHRLDFSSCRILVGTQDEGIFTDPSVIVSSYNGVYILQLSSQQEAARAYAYYFDKADFVEVDTAVGIAEGEAEDASETVMTAEENPFTELENTLPMVNGTYDIALIDTGVPEGSGIDAVSVIGESAADDNGHGSQMLGCILGQDPDAGILSIKALNSDGRGDVSGIYAAIHLAMERGVRIINLSLSAFASADSRVIEDAIREATAQGILVVGAAGNNASDASYFIPGRVEEAWIAGSAEADGIRRANSNYGPTVDVNVVAGSTSEAAAILSGFLSANGTEGVYKELNQGLIYEPDFIIDEVQPQVDESRTFRLKLIGSENATAVFCDNTGKAIKNKNAAHPNEKVYISFDVNDGCIPLVPIISVKVDNKTWSGKCRPENAADKKVLYSFYMPEADTEVRVGAINFADTYFHTAGDERSDITYKPEDVVYTTGTGFQYPVQYYENYQPLNWWNEGVLSTTDGPLIYCVDGHNNYNVGQKTVYNATVLYTQDQLNLIGGSLAWFDNLVAPSLYEKGYDYAAVELMRQLVVWNICERYAMGHHSGNSTAGFVAMNAQNDSYWIYGEVQNGNVAAYAADYEGWGIIMRDNWSQDCAQFGYKKINRNGWLQAYKFSTNTGVTDGNSNYSINGAQFTVYNASYEAVGTLTAGANGYTNKIELPEGNYLIKETRAPESGYYIEPQWAEGQWVTVTAGHTAEAPLVQWIGDTPITPSLKLKKESANPQITDDNACYSLAGAVYTVYKDAACTQTAATLTTDANGNTPAITLPLGTYYVKETTAAQNYMLDPNMYTVTLTADHTAESPYVLRVTDPPGNDPGVIELTKESNVDYATAYPLEGARFEIKYYDNTAGDVTGTPKRTWVLQTIARPDGTYRADLAKPECLVEGSDELYVNNSGTVVIPVGTISVQEIRPAQGYTLTDATLKDGEGNEIALTDGKYINTITMQNGMAHLNYGNYYTMLNTPIEIHTAAANIADGSHYAKVGAPVKIVDTVTMAGTDAERMINADGEWDYIHYRLKGELRVVGTNEKIADMTDPDTGRPYKNFVTDDFDGHKEFMECNIEDPSALEGKTLYIAENLYTVITRNVGGQRVEEETLVATEDESLFPDEMDLEMKESQRIHFPKIGTTLEGEGETQKTVMKTMTLTDTVAYKSLIPGHTYKITGVLMDKATGKEMKDDDGKKITAEKTFTPTTIDGTVEITFTFPAVLLHGKSVVAFETCYEDDQEICVHADINDDDQTVTFEPSKIGTTLKERESGLKEALVSEELKLVDTVSFSGLATDAEYTLKGVLMDKETGKPILDDEGKEIRAEKKFTPPTANGQIDMEFTFPSVLLHGKTLVAYEELFYGKEPVTEHKDLKDKHQTLDLTPTEIGTTFFNPAAEEAEDEEGLHTIYVGKQIKLTDTVAYTGAAVGAKYKMTGTIMDKATGKELLDPDGKPYTKELTFTPETPDGTVDLTFMIDAESIYGGKTLVAFEELTYKDKFIAEHKDLEDEGQTVEVLPPELHTTLIDNETHTHVANAFRTLTLTDTVAYKGLVKGTEYELKGTLMNKETGKPAVDSEGKPITATTKFTAEATEGTAEVTFTFENRDLMGGTLVAFEQLYEADTQIADHEDIEDEDQSVRLPYIGTTLTLNDTSKRFHPTQSLALNDAVALNNLDLQTTYIVRGYLVDKTSGRYLKADGTGTKEKSEAMVREVKFTANKHDARLNVEFALNASGIDFDIVCFEELYAVGTDDGKETITLVAEHSDINDEAQTVHYEPAPKTGDNSNMLLWLVLALAGLSAGAAVVTIRLKRAHR